METPGGALPGLPQPPREEMRRELQGNHPAAIVQKPQGAVATSLQATMAQVVGVWLRTSSYNRVGCLLMVVRGPFGAKVWQPRFCLSAPGQLWLHFSLLLSVCECVDD
ncbi:hypothetical protein AMECASPLE_025156 [Ameca splendens]|uniref:Uncharacterized protein n=1 Tax=Ameca splendens TaxID=208324 RepID=A0ABV0YSS3_9TELE